MAKKVTLKELQDAQPRWFTPENKRLFGDIQYIAVHGKKTGDVFLAQETNAWTDMFDGQKKPHWRLHMINQETLEIGALLKGIYQDMAEIEEYLEDL